MAKEIRNNNSFYTHRKAWLIAISLIIVAYALLALAPFTGPYFQYPLWVVGCGRQPLLGTSFGGGRYSLPGDWDYDINPIFTDRFFCSAEDAQKQGFLPSLVK